MRTGNKQARDAPTRILIGVLAPLRTASHQTSPVLLQQLTEIQQTQQNSQKTRPIEVVLADTGPHDDAERAGEWSTQTGSIVRPYVFSYANEVGTRLTTMLRLGPGGPYVQPVEPGTPLAGHGPEVGEVAFSPDGKLLATATATATANGDGDGKVQLWDPDTKKLLGALDGHTGRVYAMAFRPDDKLLASTSTSTSTSTSLLLWEHDLVVLPKNVGPTW